MISAFVVLIIIALIIMWCVKVASGRSDYKSRGGTDRCVYCQTVLKQERGRAGFRASTCRKCGKTQPWAMSSKRA